MPEAEVKSPAAPAPTPPAPNSNGSDFFRRELSGATFLSLEHFAHMALTVIVPMLVLEALLALYNIWTGNTIVGMLPVALSQTGFAAGDPSSTILSTAAALLVLVPLHVLLDKRTRAEWGKRAGYAARLAYKLPIYTALGVLAVLKTVMFIAMIATVMASLVMLSAQNAGDIGALYAQQFVPALIGLLVFGGASWYVFKLAKGRDYGKLFSTVAVVASAALIVALMMATVATLRSESRIEKPYYPHMEEDKRTPNTRRTIW